MGNQQSTSSSTKWPAQRPKPKWKPCPVKAASTAAITMHVEVETFENTTGLPLLLLPRDSDDSVPHAGTLQRHGDEQSLRSAGLTRQQSDLSNTSSSGYERTSCLQAYGLAPLQHGSSSAGSIHVISDDEDDEEEYDYGDVGGGMHTRDPKRSPAFGKTKRTKSSILSLPRNCSLLSRPSRLLKQQPAGISSTNTRTGGGPPLEALDEVITPPSPAVKRAAAAAAAGVDRKSKRRRIRHLEADATAMLSTIGEIQGTIFQENLRIIEEDAIDGWLFDMATICCKTLRRRVKDCTRAGAGQDNEGGEGGLKN